MGDDDIEFPVFAATRGGIQYGVTPPTPKPTPRPMVTRAEYDKARAVLDALPPGIYVKCAKCQGWYNGGSATITMTAGSDDIDIYCEACS